MTNRNIDIRLWLRLVDSVITPTVLYGLTASLLTQYDFEQLGVAQRKMLRMIVGWSKLPDDDWADVYRRLKAKIHKATHKHEVRDWVEELSRRKLDLRHHLGKRKFLTQRAAKWEPTKVTDEHLLDTPRRNRGRPRARWI